MELATEQYKRLDHIAKEHGFVDYQISAIPGSSKGDNFLGVITEVTIKSGEKTLEFILKTAQLGEALRKEASVGSVYGREIYMYDSVFREFKKIEEEYNIQDPFRSIPKLYAFSVEDRNEYLLMENLKSVGYKMWDKKLPMNPQHIKAVLKEYAKFHAISIAMNDKKPQLFNELSKKLRKSVFDNSLNESGPETLDIFIDATMGNAYKVVKDNPDLSECLKRIHRELADILSNKIYDAENQVAFIHGDSWCNNFLFKYEDPSNPVTPSSLRIIDWQISYYSSPAIDFSYFFLVHSTKDILEDYKAYTKLYYDTLASQLRNFNCDPEKLFPYSRFEKHLQQLMKYGFYLSVMILKVMLGDSDEATDVSKVFEDGNFLTSMSVDIRNFEAYKERLTVIIQFLKDYNFI